MERILLYLDDLEDMVYAVALNGERIRRAFGAACLLLGAAVAQLLVIVLALRDPALGAAVASLLTVAVLYRSATGSIGGAEPTAS